MAYVASYVISLLYFIWWLHCRGVQLVCKSFVFIVSCDLCELLALHSRNDWKLDMSARKF